MRWTDALKKWNMGSATWCIPRKGTSAHAEVKAIMSGKKIDGSEAEKKDDSSPMDKGIDIREAIRARNKKRSEASPKKIPMEPQRKAFSDSMAPKGKFVEPAPKAESHQERFGDEKGDHWITTDLLYAIRYNMDANRYGTLKDTSKLKDAIARFRQGNNEEIKTPHHSRIVMKLNKALDRMMKEHGRKKKISVEVINSYLQPLFTRNLML